MLQGLEEALLKTAVNYEGSSLVGGGRMKEVEQRVAWTPSSLPIVQASQGMVSDYHPWNDLNDLNDDWVHWT